MHVRNKLSFDLTWIVIKNTWLWIVLTSVHTLHYIMVKEQKPFFYETNAGMEPTIVVMLNPWSNQLSHLDH